MKNKCLLIKKKAKNNIDKIYKAWKSSKHKWLVILLILLPLFLIGTSTGRYLYANVRDFYLASKNFYFNSDKLDDPIARFMRRGGIPFRPVQEGLHDSSPRRVPRFQGFPAAGIRPRKHRGALELQHP